MGGEYALSQKICQCIEMSIVYDTVVLIAKRTKHDDVTLEKAIADIFEAEPRLYDLYLVEKEYDSTQIEKSGTTEGAIAGGDTRGRGQKIPTKSEPIFDISLKDAFIDYMKDLKEVMSNPETFARQINAPSEDNNSPYANPYYSPVPVESPFKSEKANKVMYLLDKLLGTNIFESVKKPTQKKSEETDQNR